MKAYWIFIIPLLLAVLLYLPLKTAATSEKTVYLTFDDCPTAYTEEMLDALAQHNARATFFILKVYAEQRPELVLRMLQDGHAVGLHGIGHNKAHFYKDALSPLWEMDELRVMLFHLTGKEFYLARTPFGSLPSLTQTQYRHLIDSGYVLWDWNVDTRDALCSRAEPSQIVRRATEGILREETPVILMHNMRASARALPAILAFIDERGYQTKTLSDTKEQPICFAAPQ